MRTAARWFKDPDFKQALRQAETAAIDGAVRKLVSGAAAAVDVLVELLDPAVDVSNRRHAAKSLLDALVRLRDTMTTEERLTILEERLERK